jgi:hypothetical protein
MRSEVLLRRYMGAPDELPTSGSPWVSPGEVHASIVPLAPPRADSKPPGAGTQGHLAHDLAQERVAAPLHALTPLLRLSAGCESSLSLGAERS